MLSIGSCKYWNYSSDDDHEKKFSILSQLQNLTSLHLHDVFIEDTSKSLNSALSNLSSMSSLELSNLTVLRQGIEQFDVMIEIMATVMTSLREFSIYSNDPFTNRCDESS